MAREAYDCRQMQPVAGMLLLLLHLVVGAVLVLSSGLWLQWLLHGGLVSPLLLLEVVVQHGGEPPRIVQWFYHRHRTLSLAPETNSGSEFIIKLPFIKKNDKQKKH